MTLPTLSPAERFYPALTAANTARAAAAGGVEHIVTDADVDRAIAAANDADRQALRTAQRQCRWICAATSIAPNCRPPPSTPPQTTVPSSTCSPNKQISRQSCESWLPPANITSHCRCSHRRGLPR